MKPRSFWILLLVIFTAAGSAAADTVALKNGINLTGSIESFDGKVLTLKTDYADDVRVQWSAVKEITSTMPIYIVTAAQTVGGNVTTEGTNLVIRTPAGANVTVPLADVKQIRSQAGETAYEKSLHPPLYDAWKLGVNFGFALARGNSNTTTLNTGFTGDRKTMNDEITLYESSVYTTSNVPGVSSGVTANEILGGAKYDRNITKDLFGFVSGDFTHDALQDLIVRQIYTGGLGWHAIGTPNTTIDVMAGINYTRETYSAGATSTGVTTGVNRNLPGVTLGESFMHKFNNVTTATEQFYFYPDLSNTGQYRFSLDSALNTKIKTWLAWQVAFSDRYVTNPPILGTKSNDAIFTTGLNITFNH